MRKRPDENSPGRSSFVMSAGVHSRDLAALANLASGIAAGRGFAARIAARRGAALAGPLGAEAVLQAGLAARIAASGLAAGRGRATRIAARRGFAARIAARRGAALAGAERGFLGANPIQQARLAAGIAASGLTALGGTGIAALGSARLASLRTTGVTNTGVGGGRQHAGDKRRQNHSTHHGVAPQQEGTKREPGTHFVRPLAPRVRIAARTERSTNEDQRRDRSRPVTR